MNRKLTLLVLVCFNIFLNRAFAQKVPKSTGSKVPQEEAQAALDFHNKVRKDVGTAPLEWSSDLAKYAQAWADHLAKDNDCKMQHRPHDGKWKQQHGENIYWSGGSDSNAADASEMWYSEINDYKLTKVTSANFSKTGHYTQMVWKNTTKVGIGQAVCPTGAIIIVGNYSPPGNYIGEKPY